MSKNKTFYSFNIMSIEKQYNTFTKTKQNTEKHLKLGPQVQFLDWEDALEMEMATYSSIFSWEILWTEEPVGLQSMGLQKSDMT